MNPNGRARNDDRTGTNHTSLNKHSFAIEQQGTSVMQHVHATTVSFPSAPAAGAHAFGAWAAQGGSGPAEHDGKLRDGKSQCGKQHEAAGSAGDKHPHDSVEQDAESDDASDNEGGRLEDVRVLIVDDDRDVLQSFEAAFASEGASTMTAQDGNEAVLLCQRHEPDLVILDMMLPKRSGFLVLEKIKGTEQSPLVIMVTANEGKRHMAYAQSLGVDAYVQKPVPLAKLIDTAIELLGR
jgi:CheY-like chemotaxis protein